VGILSGKKEGDYLKPILFNTEMVRAILDGRKTTTRRVIKNGNRSPTGIGRNKLYTFVETLNRKPFFGAGFYKNSDVYAISGELHTDAEYFKMPYCKGDILYVRETFAYQFGIYWYKAGPYPKNTTPPEKWHPSIHMPKEAARIFLKVTDVRAERLQDITEEQAIKEGCITFNDKIGNGKFDDFLEFDLTARDAFAGLWNSTVKDLDRYGWNANPWVWVIEFERTAKPDA